MSERARRALFYTLVAVETLGAAVFMASAIVDDTHWMFVTGLTGLITCIGAATVSVVLLRRWGADGDFWWPDNQ
jgi:hypothetical protein